MKDENRSAETLARFEAWVNKALDPRTLNPLLRRRKRGPYPRFNDRLAAGLLDCCLLMLLLGPMILRVHLYLVGPNPPVPQEVTGPWDMFYQMKASGLLTKLLIEQLVTYAITSVFIVACWSYASATPGMWLLRMRIVRDGDLGKPSFAQWWLRYFGYLFIVPGFLWVLFDKKRRALHDLIARTLVVRVRHWRIADRGDRPQITEEELSMLD